MTAPLSEEPRNVGHGHVFPRPDGHKARCGGPAFCLECKKDAALAAGNPNPDPLKPSIVLLMKLGSLVVHLEEFIDTGQPFDQIAANGLREDADVKAWFVAMHAQAMLPVKR